MSVKYFYIVTTHNTCCQLVVDPSLEQTKDYKLVAARHDGFCKGCLAWQYEWGHISRDLRCESTIKTGLSTQCSYTTCTHIYTA